MSIIELLTSYDLVINVNHEVCLNDFYEKITQPKELWAPLLKTRKSKANYCVRVDDRDHYINTWNLCRLIQNSGNVKIKNFYKKYKSVIDSNTLDKTRSIVDAHDNIFIYLGTKIHTIIIDHVYYFCLTTINQLCKSKISKKLLSDMDIHHNGHLIYVSHKDITRCITDGKTNVDFIKWIEESTTPHIDDELNFINGVTKVDSNNNINLNDYADHYCVYFIKVRHNTYKYGDSYIIKNRMHTHADAFKKFDYVKLYKFEDYRQMKKMARNFKFWTNEVNINYKDSNDRVEMFKTCEKYSIDVILDKANDIFEVTNIPLQELIDNRVIFKLIDKFVEKCGEKESMSMIDDEFSLDDAEYLKKKIFKQIKGVKVMRTDKTYDQKKILKYCNYCSCGKCFDRKKYSRNSNEYCKICNCTNCITIKTNLCQERNNQKRKKQCPDCNSLIHESSDKCHACYSETTRKVTRPSYDVLIQEIQDTSYVAVGKKYGVSDKAIRKWIDNYRKLDPNYKPREMINGQYRCEEDGCDAKTSRTSLQCRKCMLGNRKYDTNHQKTCTECTRFVGSRDTICSKCKLI